jgi:hypothetical protein
MSEATGLLQGLEPTGLFHPVFIENRNGAADCKIKVWRSRKKLDIWLRFIPCHCEEQ